MTAAVAPIWAYSSAEMKGSVAGFSGSRGMLAWDGSRKRGLVAGTDAFDVSNRASRLRRQWEVFLLKSLRSFLSTTGGQ